MREVVASCIGKNGHLEQPCKSIFSYFEHESRGGMRNTDNLIYRHLKA